MWNDELAQVAQTYSERCMFAHNPDRASQAPSFSSVGENLAISPALGDNYEGLFMSWHNERSAYNFTTNSCSRVCGHYTQVRCIAISYNNYTVWSDPLFLIILARCHTSIHYQFFCP